MDGDTWLPESTQGTGGEDAPIFGGTTKDPAGVYGAGAGGDTTGGPDKPRKYQIGNRVTVAIARERIQYLDAHGKLVTESLRDFTRINLAKSLIAADKEPGSWLATESWCISATR